VQWSTRRFFGLLGLVTAAGLAVRLGYVIGVRWDQKLWGDAFTYHFTANGLADGLGFQRWIPKSFVRDAGNVLLNPPESWSRIAVAVGPSANNRPVFPLYLAGWSVLGLRSYHWHMIATTVLGTGSVFMMGLVGRKIAGPRAGIIAALIAAVYGNFWVNDSVGTAESMAILLTTIILLFTYRAWEKPTLWRVVGIGALCGFSALVRSEFLLLAPLLVIPLLVRRQAGHPMKERIGWLFAAGAATVLVMSPWVIRNLTTFDKPVILGADGGVTLAATNCDETYYGPSLGWWSPECTIHVALVKRDGRCRAVPAETAVVTEKRTCDPAEGDAVWNRRARQFIGDHLDRLPVVLAARLGRMWELYHPGSPWGHIQPNQKIAYDITEGRSEMAARLSLAQFYLIMPFAIAGAVIMWRRKQTIAPLVALPILTSFTAMYTFGNTRYRSIAEPALVAFAAVAVEVLLVRFWDRRRGRDAEPPEDPSRTEELQPV
jgi:hypothetical protein